MKASNKKYVERLEQLIRVMLGLSSHERRKHWYMGVWGTKTECGTVACAAGHAGMDPWFRRRGFRLIPGLDVWDRGHMSIDVRIFFGDEKDEKWRNNDWISIFIEPRTVNGVIRAAKRRIKKLQAQK